MILAVLIALAAAAVQGWASVAQQKVASSVPLTEGGLVHLVGRLVRRPLWLAAIVASLIGFGLHAWSLGLGDLLAVEPVSSTALLFALGIGALWAHQRLPWRIWIPAIVLVIGLAVFLIAGDPDGKHEDAPFVRWGIAWLVIIPVVVFLVVFAFRRKGGVGRALPLGFVSGILFGLVASLTKAVTLDFGMGIVGELENWETWGLLVCGILAFLLQQAAFQAGSIALVLPAAVIMPPITAAMIGIFVLESTMDLSGLRPIWIALSVVAMVGGLVVIARAEATRMADDAAPSGL